VRLSSERIDSECLALVKKQFDLGVRRAATDFVPDQLLLLRGEPERQHALRRVTFRECRRHYSPPFSSRSKYSGLIPSAAASRGLRGSYAGERYYLYLPDFDGREGSVRIGGQTYSAIDSSASAYLLIDRESFYDERTRQARLPGYFSGVQLRNGLIRLTCSVSWVYCLFLFPCK